MKTEDQQTYNKQYYDTNKKRIIKHAKFALVYCILLAFVHYACLCSCVFVSFVL